MITVVRCGQQTPIVAEHKMTNCCIKGCTTSTRNCSKSKNGITFHGFPADPIRDEAWSRIIRKQRRDPYFKHCKSSKVCSLHFTADSFYTTKKGMIKLKDTALPRLKLKPEPTSNSEQQQSLQEDDIDQHLEEDNLKDVDISDLEYIFDLPLTKKLKCKIEKYEMQHIKDMKTIKRLRMELHRLRKKNVLLQGIVKNLKKKRVLKTESETNLVITPELPISRPIKTESETSLVITPELPISRPIKTESETSLLITPELPISRPIKMESETSLVITPELPIFRPIKTESETSLVITPELPIFRPIKTESETSLVITPALPIFTPIKTESETSLVITRELPIFRTIKQEKTTS